MVQPVQLVLVVGIHPPDILMHQNCIQYLPVLPMLPLRTPIRERVPRMPPGRDLLVFVLRQPGGAAVVGKEVLRGPAVLLRTVAVRSVRIVLIVRVGVCESVVAVTGDFGAAVWANGGTFRVVTVFLVVGRAMSVCFVLVDVGFGCVL